METVIKFDYYLTVIITEGKVFFQYKEDEVSLNHEDFKKVNKAFKKLIKAKKKRG